MAAGVPVPRLQQTILHAGSLTWFKQLNGAQTSSTVLITPMLLIQAVVKNANNPPEIKLLNTVVKDKPFRPLIDPLSLSSSLSSSESVLFSSDIGQHSFDAILIYSAIQ